MTTMTDEHPPITLGGLKAWAEANGVTDDAELALRPAGSDTDHPVRDLDHEDPEPGEEPDPDDLDDPGTDPTPERLVLMQRWGD